MGRVRWGNLMVVVLMLPERLRGGGNRWLHRELDGKSVRDLLYTFSSEGGNVKKTLTSTTYTLPNFLLSFGQILHNIA